MKSLVALAECGSIREASLACNLSPAAIHKHLKTLEYEFGVQIYKKRHGRLVVTEAGQNLLPFLREILLRYESAFTAMGEWKGAKRGLVRVGAGPTFSSDLLPALLKQFSDQFPKVDLFVETGDSSHLMSRLRSGALDVAFDLASVALEDTSLEQLALWESQAGFISAGDLAPKQCPLKELQAMPFILFQKGSPMGTIVQNYLDGLNLCPNVVMRSDSSEAIKAMIRAGLGMAVLFLWNVDADLQRSDFTIVQTDAPPLTARFALIRVRGTYLCNAVSEFVDLARKIGWKHLRPVKGPHGYSSVSNLKR